MSKFKRSRDDKQTLNPIKEETIVHAADDVVIINHSGTTASNETKTTSVMLTAEDASLLEQLSKLEDRSQRKIASRILREGIRESATRITSIIQPALTLIYTQFIFLI